MEPLFQEYPMHSCVTSRNIELLVFLGSLQELVVAGCVVTRPEMCFLDWKNDQCPWSVAPEVGCEKDLKTHFTSMHGMIIHQWSIGKRLRLDWLGNSLTSSGRAKIPELSPAEKAEAPGRKDSESKCHWRLCFRWLSSTRWGHASSGAHRGCRS